MALFCFFNIADIISTDDAEGVDRDITWMFVKEAGQPGLFHTAPAPLENDDTLVRYSMIIVFVVSNNTEIFMPHMAR